MPTSKQDTARLTQTASERVAKAGAPEQGADHRKTILRRLAKVALGVALAVALDVLLCLALEPYGGKNEVIWTEYRACQDEPIDTLTVGSSYAELDINPLVLDQSALGSNTVGLGTPGQCLADSDFAVRTAIRDHRLKRVVLALEESTVINTPWPNSSVTFHQAAALGQSPAGAVATYGHLLTNPYFFARGFSLAALVPWSMEHVDYTREAVAANIASRTSGMSPVEALERLEPTYHYQGRGFGGAVGTLDYSTVGTQVASEVYSVKNMELKDYNLAALEDICRVCQDEGVELYVVCPPQPTFQVLSYGKRYASDFLQVETLIESYGAHLLDFNLAKADYYVPADDEFTDTEHLNLDGANRFSMVLGDTIARMEAGEDVSSDFYGLNNMEAWSASLEGVSLVNFTAEPAAGALEVKAKAYAGSSVEVEYRFEVLDGATGAWTVVRDYDTDRKLTLPVEGHGAVTLRVLARTVGSDVEAERTYTQVLGY